MQAVVLGWDIYERTGSVLAIGWIGVAQFVPSLLFFLPAGQLADRYERRMLLAISFAISAAASLLPADPSKSTSAPPQLASQTLLQ